jgi:hypothetical protein
MDSDYRRKDEEIMSDAITSVVLEPGAARREAPDLVEKVEEEYQINNGELKL